MSKPVPTAVTPSGQPHSLYATHDDRGDNDTTDFVAKRAPVGATQRFKYIAMASAGVSLVLLIVVIAVASGKKGPSCGVLPTPPLSSGAFTDDSKIAARVASFAAMVNNASIKSFMTEYSLYPHNTATARNVALAEMTADFYKSYGFDEYRVDRIPVLLSSLINHSVVVNNVDGTARYTASLYEPNLIFELNYSQAILPSNAYSGNGNVTAPIVWVNYGRLQDYQAVAKAGIDLKGKIAVARYGAIFRGNKAAFAQQYGAVGCIIVMDPADVAKGPVFPYGPWATNQTVQRGSLMLSDGDPRTPLWPSEDGGPTVSDADLFDPTKGVGTALPTIPVQPMGYADATEMLRGLGGVALPNASDWQSTGFKTVANGGMGPSKYTVQLAVFRDLVVDHLANAHGVIRGSVEPDRVVVIGGHRDAWTYGAVDPISGASISLEVARCFGELLKAGWRPRRTIQFSSWGGEEQALLGSTEFVQAEVEMLRERAVAYINLDTPVTGNDVFTLEGSPSFLPLALEAAGSYTAYQSSLLKRMATQSISAPGSGSDHTSFIQLAGVPVFVPELTSSDGRYDAVYHTNYDTVFWVEHFGDPQYDGHKAVAQLVGDMAIKLADRNILPLSATAYASSVEGWVSQYATPAATQLFDFSFMNTQVSRFTASAKQFEATTTAAAAAITNEYPAVQTVTPYVLRDLNDRLSGLERVFLGGSQETLSLFFKHVLFTPSAIDSYGSSVMPMVAAAFATGDAVQGDFALGRIAQFVSRAARFLNTTTRIL